MSTEWLLGKIFSSSRLLSFKHFFFESVYICVSWLIFVLFASRTQKLKMVSHQNMRSWSAACSFSLCAVCVRACACGPMCGSMSVLLILMIMVVFLLHVPSVLPPQFFHRKNSQRGNARNSVSPRSQRETSKSHPVITHTHTHTHTHIHTHTHTENSRRKGEAHVWRTMGVGRQTAGRCVTGTAKCRRHIKP